MIAALIAAFDLGMVAAFVICQLTWRRAVPVKPSPEVQTLTPRTISSPAACALCDRPSLAGGLCTACLEVAA